MEYAVISVLLFGVAAREEIKGVWYKCLFKIRYFDKGIKLLSFYLCDRWLNLPEPGSDSGFFLLKGIFSFPLSPNPAHKGSSDWVFRH